MSVVDDDKIRIAGVIKESTVDGPGFRYAIFTQGCPHHCEGCHNPGTHDMNGGKLESITTLAEDITKNPLLKGITLSGGEPFMQAKKLAKLLSLIVDLAFKSSSIKEIEKLVQLLKDLHSRDFS